ncbi:hypothetical protein VCE7224_01651 [Vibrio celticus]|uniref:Uncharacterized protein n=1 Tax=Vibrio celticus TaxID=446372 RepID=A0A1C3JCQ5_9VIBR|nr:hypothetical protein VCE7224_01651 [Vibrio celticus]
MDQVRMEIEATDKNKATQGRFILLCFHFFI